MSKKGPQKGILRGRKISSRHSTIIPGANKLITSTKKMECVSKIVLGEIVSVRGNKRRLKFVPIQAGLRMVLRSTRHQQTFFIYTSNPEKVEKSLYAVWQEITT